MYRQISGEAESVYDESVIDLWENNVLPSLLGDYTIENTKLMNSDCFLS